jgi:hypothetical protein
MRAAWELSDGLGELLTGQLAPTKHRAELTQSQGGAQRLAEYRKAPVLAGLARQN